MIRFKHNLKAEDGWLSPDGVLMECKFAMHVEAAEDIIKKFQPKCHRIKWDYRHQPDDMLKDLGWMQLTGDENYNLGHGWWPQNVELTQPQIDTIFDYYNSRGLRVPDFIKRMFKDNDSWSARFHKNKYGK